MLPHKNSDETIIILIKDKKVFDNKEKRMSFYAILVLLRGRVKDFSFITNELI